VIDLKILKRAILLLDRTRKDTGREAELAAERLGRLTREHDWLPALLEQECEDEESSWIDLRLGSRAHHVVASDLASSYECDMGVLFDDLGVPVMRVSGRGSMLSAFLADWRNHQDTLDAFIELLASSLLGPARGDGDHEESGDEQPPDGEEKRKPDPRMEAFWRAERESCQGALLALASCADSFDKLSNGVAKLADMLDPGRKDRVRALLADGGDGWDDPDMSFDDFVARYRTAFPRGRLDEEALRWSYYRAGRRLDPLTGRWRYVESCHRDKDSFHTGE